MAAEADAEAWAHVADGYELALNVEGLSERTHAFLLRQLRLADQLASRPPLRLVSSAPQAHL